MDNIYVRTDPVGNIKPDKEKSTERIKGAIATIIALDERFDIKAMVLQFMMTGAFCLYDRVHSLSKNKVFCF